MVDKTKTPDREQALIEVLKRLAGEMERQDETLNGLLERQDEFTKSFERAESHRRTKQVDSDIAHDKLQDSFYHYRSDMLKLVNEQDHINKNIDDLENLIKTTIFSMEVTTKKLDELDERLTQQEKALKTHSENSIEQGEVFRNEIVETNRNLSRLHADTEKSLMSEIVETNRSFTKLHADTEKNLSNLHRDTQSHLTKFRKETTQRLLMLDGIVTSLQTLLVRTDPELKKSPWIVRFFRKIGSFFKIRLPLIISKYKIKIFGFKE